MYTRAGEPSEFWGIGEGVGLPHGEPTMMVNPLWILVIGFQTLAIVPPNPYYVSHQDNEHQRV
jgi:hypothetical protein